MPDPAERQALPDHSASPAVVYIAKCVEHGLHGERDDCFICEKPVDHVSYVRADEYANRLEDLRRIEAERDRLRAENEQLRDELGYRPSDTNGYCPACGRYQPKTLGGDETSCDCGRTPPSSNLPPNIYVCPVCHGHGASRFGCWGTQAKPHGHAYMRPMLELLVPKEDRPPQPDLMAALEASLRSARASDEQEATD